MSVKKNKAKSVSRRDAELAEKVNKSYQKE